MTVVRKNSCGDYADAYNDVLQLELQTFSELVSERVPSECRHCRLTYNIFIKEFSLADSPDILPIYYYFVKTTYLKEESKSKLNIMLEIG